DGHLSFLTPSIEYRSYLALATRAGQETLHTEYRCHAAKLRESNVVTAELRGTAVQNSPDRL
ncbi:MAG: hypothetical protein ACK6EB_46980, partial [Planctomyces sp.]